MMYVYIYSCIQHHAALRERAGACGARLASGIRLVSRPMETRRTSFTIARPISSTAASHSWHSWVTSLGHKIPEQADLMITKFLNRLTGMGGGFGDCLGRVLVTRLEELTDPLLDGE